ncbi:hypothetical protein ACHAXR_000994 [Thalassiosira sp. AJA248-18]
MASILYLGAGQDAIVRPGVVLVAQYDNFLMRSSVFVYAIGLDENVSTIIRGKSRYDFLLFAIYIKQKSYESFLVTQQHLQLAKCGNQNQLFRGGYDGSDSAMILHSAGGPNGPVKSDTAMESVDAGLIEPDRCKLIFERGIVSAMESVDAGLIEPDRSKFFFNYRQFTEKELDDMFSGTEDMEISGRSLGQTKEQHSTDPQEQTISF